MAEQRATDEQKLISTIEETRDRIVALKEEKRKIVEERRKLIEERRKLVEERRALVQEYRNHKEQLRALREEFLKVKEERDAVKKEAMNKREDLKIARQLAEKEGEVAKISLRRLQRRLEELEWKQMTTVMRPEEEKKLVEEIARVESMILKVREARKHVISLMELQADYKSTLLKLKGLNEKLSRMWQRLNELRTKLNELGNKIGEANRRIEELSREIEIRSLKLDDLSKEIDGLYSNYKESLTKLNEMKEARRLGIQLELLEKKKKEVKEKAERGEPLTLEELKILYGELE
ncbi:MAG: hypothetical protein NZ902_02650 [Acidilobaceae archaeon]|nr:hypothetical protein [Acidilobaceae archaeon]MDW7974145.1 hypothetical protein [Sulfolobales archaeon]